MRPPPFVKPTYTATVQGTVGALASAAVVFTKPVYVASVLAAAGPATALAAATFAPGMHTASVSALVGGATALVSVEFVAPPIGPGAVTLDRLNFVSTTADFVDLPFTQRDRANFVTATADQLAFVG